MANARERSDYSQAVAAQVRAERAAAALTQEEVYGPAGLGRSTYIRLEAGSRVADTTQLARICAVFGIPVSEFFRRVEARLERGKTS